MSARQVRKTTLALLQDGALGLKPAVIALATAEGLTNIVSDFNYVPAALTGKMLPSGAPNIVVRGRQWNPNQKLRGPQRDAMVTLETGQDPLSIKAAAAGPRRCPRY